MIHFSATKRAQDHGAMNRIALAAVLALLAAAPAAAAAFGAADQADLRRVSDYLNSIQSAEGRFLQIGPDGRVEEGRFYLRKPGRVRFEYNPPNPNLIVADGVTIAVENSQLKTTDRYPLTDSPLRLLLSSGVDLGADPRIVSVRREEGGLGITARQDSGLAQGEITLQFADAAGALELRQWEVVDAQGLRTIVAVSEMRRGVDIPARLFVIEELSPFQRQQF